MIYGLWQSAAGLLSQQTRQAVLANNLANVDTPGFKPDWVNLRERPIAAVEGRAFGDGATPRHPLLDDHTGGLTYAPVHTDFAPGSLVPSTNPLDLAIEGDGFLAVQTRDGERYTRDGRLTLRGDGTLVTASGGFEVLDERGQAIRIDRTTGEKIDIDSAGVVRQGATQVAELRITAFADRTALKKVGQNLFDATAAQPAESTGSLRQFAYESSAADPMAGLTRLIEATRAYQLNATMLSIQDETLGRAVNDVGRLA